MDEYAIVRIDVNLFIHPPISGHLGRFQVGALTNKAAINIHITDLFIYVCGDHRGT